MLGVRPLFERGQVRPTPALEKKFFRRALPKRRKFFSWGRDEVVKIGLEWVRDQLATDRVVRLSSYVKDLPPVLRM